MAARSNVPQFGNWDEGSPYTIYFEKARKNKGGKMINPNDPSENPDMFLNMSPSPLAPAAPAPLLAPATPLRTRQDPPIGRGAVRPTDGGGGDYRQLSNSSTRSENPGPRPVNKSNYGVRGQKPTLGSEQSFENLPRHPSGRGGGGAPLARDGRNNISTHGTPSRPRPRPSRVDESPERSPAVPKFGDWNDSNPESAENFTHIFEKVRDRRNADTANNAPATPKRTPYNNVPRNKPSRKPKNCCCFPW